MSMPCAKYEKLPCPYCDRREGKSWNGSPNIVCVAIRPPKPVYVLDKCPEIERAREAYVVMKREQRGN